VDKRQGRLVGIDALRGIAAMGVVYYHVVGNFRMPLLPPAARWFALPTAFGFTGVYLFFVISGFCIHLRWAKTAVETGSGRVDFLAFWKRRIWRLYPPYLVCLVLYLLLTLLLGHFQLSRFLAYDLATHVLMVHNLDRRTVYSINGVFWTLAIEEQLYLGYFVLLSRLRRSQ
jgi:peptidoglycan/LPS O-acetylase OafA/YrhL